MTAGDDPGVKNGATDERSVLFTDIVDSTGILHAHGEDAGRRLLVQCLDMMTTVVEECGGLVVDRIGDELFCLFNDPDKAAHAASQMQQQVVNGHAAGVFDVPMRIRVGFEHGPITQTENELYGKTIHAAKRLVDMAKAGQILTTKGTLDQLGPLRRRMERYFDTIVLKGMASETDIHELLWDTSATMVPRGARRRRREKQTSAVELRYGDETVRVDANQPRVTLGRDSTCNLQLEGNSVSRLHARILWNRGKVRVEDVSTNGTCIETACGTATALHHDGAELQGEGVLRCGCLGPDEDSALVLYACVVEEA